MRHSVRLMIIAFVLFFALAPASEALVLTFEGLQDSEQILNFYNGGFGGSGSGPGPNFGITFGPDSLALIDSDAGGSGNFANEPSPDTIAFFLTGPGVTMNVPAGFQTGFSFFYTSSRTGSVTVWDGPNATGTLLGTVPLVAQFQSCNLPGDPTGDFRCWDPVGVAFAGIARSVLFSGAADQVGFDNITLGSEIPGVPEPGTLILFGTGIGLIGIRRRRSRR